MTSHNLYVDINVLQSVPSANLNRDDTGMPKTALYGGVTRARVSSQSWKHAMRESWKGAIENFHGLRTKDAAQAVGQAIQALRPELDEDSAKAKVDELFSTVGIKLDKNRQTGALLMVSPGQVQKLAQYALDNDKFDKKALKAVFKNDQSLDLAVFGRMVADDPELNVDAAAQVAHALSTHEIVPEFDYYTAMDDLKPDDTAGAAMLGSVGFNSATLYRYANLNVRELQQNLGVDATQIAVEAFLKAFVLTMPTGKQNSFANKTVPNYVMVTIRTDTPVNLVSAFEAPIKARESGYVEPSIKALEAEFTNVEKFVAQPVNTFVLSTAATTLGTAVDNITDLLTQVSATVKQVDADEKLNN